MRDHPTCTRLAPAPARRGLRRAVLGFGAMVLALAGAPALAEPAVKALSFGLTSAPFLGQRELLGWSDHGVARFTYAKRTETYGFTAAIGVESDRGKILFDGSHVERYFGNWTLGAGAVERHWSPSRYTSLILSRNARPLPSVYLAKSTATAFETPLLSWLGPWDGEVFVTAPDSQAGPGDGRLFGARFRFRPLNGLEIDLVRTAQWSGGAGAFWDMLIGDTNEGTSAEINQMAGLGISYSLPEHILPARAYLQAIGEDESGGLPSCFMYLAGVELDTTLRGVPTRITLEGVDTRISTTENGFCGPNTAYNQHTYPYTRDGTVMGAAIDSEGYAANLHVRHELPRFDLSWGLGHATINDASSSAHRLSSVRVSGPQAYLGVATDWQGLQVEALVAHQGFDLDKADLDKGLRIAIGVSRRF